MNPEDISKYYYCFTRANFSGDGRFYKYLQKALSKTIKQFDSGNLRYMFINFDQEDRCRLNRGVRGRLEDRLKTLMDQRKMKGFDVQYIYDKPETSSIQKTLLIVESTRYTFSVGSIWKK